MSSSKRKDSNSNSSSRLQDQIKALEDEIVKPRSWDLSGEVKGKDRPENSLLGIVADVDRASKPQPLISQEYTSSLEDLIKKRIKDNKFDDVVPYVSTSNSSSNNGMFPTDSKNELSQDRNRTGLGEIYADDFMAQTLKVEKKISPDDLAAREELTNLFHKVSRQLDSLTHFHYTPKPIIVEASVTASLLPSIQFEDVGLSSESNAQSAAPAEIYLKKKGRDASLLSSAEMTSDDKKRLRHAIKEKNKNEKKKISDEHTLDKDRNSDKTLTKFMNNDKRIIQGKVSSEDNKYSNSTNFFDKLEHDIHDNIVDTKKNKKSKR